MLRLAPFLLCLVASPARAQEAPPVVAVEPAAEPVAEPEVDALLIIVPVYAEPEAQTAIEIREADVAVAETYAEPAAPQSFEPGPFSVGLSGMVGLRDDAHGDLAPTWTGGLDLSLRVAPWIAVALRRISFSMAETLGGDRYALGGSPAAEIGGRVWERVETYAQVGLAIQSRFGGDQSASLGLAPFAAGGVRFYVADCFSIAIEGALHVPATERFLFGSTVFPQGALLFTGGLALAFHIR